ncbi:uncharacterized protein Triagg1_4961 [Trichoderma aggressivum f. europaeum]|uniref:Uncharacterized protein n=1 Tax=Trichoderma aggressivum f. europaeum TaxID=173218 RepID=A0AAE1ID34_9HYPO|nr:hypothetical protein Triagg1_4961 [Trichoderma aggressivum f. europaeum]
MLFSIHHLPSIASQAAEKLSGIRVTSPPSVTNLGAPFIKACGRLFRAERFMRLRGPNKTNGACPSRRPTLVSFFFPSAVRLLAASTSSHIPPSIFTHGLLTTKVNINTFTSTCISYFSQDPPQFADARPSALLIHRKVCL